MVFELIIKVVHIASAAVFWAYPMGIARDIVESLGRGQSEAESMQSRVGRMRLIASRFGWLTFLTGFGLIFLRGGFSAVPIAIHVSITLVFAMLVLDQVFARQIWLSVCEHIDARGDLLAAQTQARGLFKIQGIVHTLWLGTLVLMVFRHLF